MRGILGAMIGGMVGGAIGAAIWAAVAYFANIEIGWIAWGVGGLVGLGAALGARGETGIETGVAAAVIALIAVAAGKYAAVGLYVNEINNKVVASIHFTEVDAQEHMAHQLADQALSEGKTLKWPEGKSLEDAETQADYPKEIWKDMSARWKSMTPDERAQYVKAAEDQAKHSIASIASSVRDEGFQASFGAFDLLWFGLALFTAFKVGAGMSGDGD